MVTNRDFLVATLRSPEFIAGDTTTDFIERVAPDPSRPLNDAELSRVAVAAALWLQGANRAAATTLGSLPSGWRNARLPPERVEVGLGDRTITTHYRGCRDGTFAIGFDADKGTATVHRWSAGSIDVEWAGVRSAHRVTRDGESLHLTGPVGGVTLRLVPRFELPGSEAATGALVAPMPGLVLDVRVAAGDIVEVGQTLVVIEAMKMEHHISAGVTGTVTEVYIEKGQQLENGQALLVIEPDGDPRTDQ